MNTFRNKPVFVKSSSDYTRGVIPYVVNIPSGDWRPFHTDHTKQMLKFDTDECSELSPIKSLEAQCNWLKSSFSQEAINFFTTNGYFDSVGNFSFSDEFNAILDGTSINGNNPWALVESVRTQGVIPRTMLQMTVEDSQQYATQEAQDVAYYDKSRITPAMLALGLQSLKYISVGNFWINNGNGNTLMSVLVEYQKQAPLIIGVPIPADVNQWNSGVVKWDGGKELAHCVDIEYIDTSAFPFYIGDNYNPFVKTLSSDYWISQVVMSIVSVVPIIQSVQPTISLSVVAQLMLLLKWLKLIN